MTPEERQLLLKLADRVKNTPAQQRDAEADQLLRELSQERPDTVYILAQTVLMQDFALRNAQAQIDDLQRQLSQMQPSQGSSTSFLGGLLGGGSDAQQRSSGSVPNVNPWTGPQRDRFSGDYPPPPPPAAGSPGYAPTGPVMQPSQTSSFLRNAATTAAGVAGGALLFQGINSLFSSHTGLPGGQPGGATPPDSLSETTVNNYYGDDQASKPEQHAAANQGDNQGVADADYTDDDDFGDDGDMGGSDVA